MGAGKERKADWRGLTQRQPKPVSILEGASEVGVAEPKVVELDKERVGKGAVLVGHSGG